MRKLSTLFLLALLLSPAFFAPSTASTAIPVEPELVTVCYYGVTLTVSPKIAKRYIKIGATMGACGETEPEPCPLGTVRIEITPGNFICFPIGIGFTSTVEKPADSQKVIQLPQPANAATKVIWSLETEKLAVK